MPTRCGKVQTLNGTQPAEKLAEPYDRDGRGRDRMGRPRPVPD